MQDNHYHGRIKMHEIGAAVHDQIAHSIAIVGHQAQGGQAALTGTSTLTPESESMQDISIDIETLSTRFDAAILSIGAVAFDRNTGEIGEKLYVEVDVADAIAHGHVAGSTLEWWMQQSERARQLFGAPGKSHLAVVLDQLSTFVTQRQGAKVWGNGATFDITILEHAYARMSKPVPWKFWDIRDMRTIVEAATKVGLDKHSVPFEGTAHNAVDDAIHQARVIARSWGFCCAPAAPIFRPTDDALWDQTLQERDRYHEVADELAAQIAAITQQEIGEHSSANCPWRNAMLAADEFIAQQFRDFLASPGLDAKKAAPERLCLSKFTTLDDYLVAKAAQAAELVAANEQNSDLIAIVAAQTQACEPVAWAVLAENGNCRIWFGAKKSATEWAKTHNATLTPLFSTPPAEVPPPAEIKTPSVCTCPSGDGSLAWPCPQHSSTRATDREEFIRQAVSAVAEMDRDSPEDQPEMMLVSPQELRGCLESAFERADEEAELVTDLIAIVASQPHPGQAARDVIAERSRQVEHEGYAPEHDDAYPNGEIAAYAAFYAMPPAAREWPTTEIGYGATFGEAIVPADWTAPKTGERRRELVKAGALILAEIERIDRTAIARQEAAT